MSCRDRTASQLQSRNRDDPRLMALHELCKGLARWRMCRTVRSPYFVSLVVTPAPNFTAGGPRSDQNSTFADRPMLQSLGPKSAALGSLSFKRWFTLGFVGCPKVYFDAEMQLWPRRSLSSSGTLPRPLNTGHVKRGKFILYLKNRGAGLQKRSID